MGNGNGIAALVFGIISLFFNPFLIMSILAIIFGAIGKKNDDSPGMAIAGLVLGLIGLILFLVFLFVLGGLLFSFGF
ncbi:MAG: DUF4190 domain-containing protein [Promethearchaeota archaeon]